MIRHVIQLPEGLEENLLLGAGRSAATLTSLTYVKS